MCRKVIVAPHLTCHFECYFRAFCTVGIKYYQKKWFHLLSWGIMIVHHTGAKSYGTHMDSPIWDPCVTWARCYKGNHLHNVVANFVTAVRSIDWSSVFDITDATYMDMIHFQIPFPKYLFPRVSICNCEQYVWCQVTTTIDNIW